MLLAAGRAHQNAFLEPTMATECSALLRGKVARLTRVDSCGNPIFCDAPNATMPQHVVSDGIISIQIEPEIDNGTDITQTNWAGDSCIDEPACPKIRWINITAQFCRMDPDLFSLWTGVPVIKDAQGNATGFRVRKSVTCDEGVALEIWTGSKAEGRCSGTGAKAKYGYIVIPWVVNGVLGSYTIENGAVTFQITAKGVGGGAWGVGPYDVYETATSGTNAPLSTPFGEDDLEHIDVTTLPPPSASCGFSCAWTRPGPTITVTKLASDVTGQTSSLDYDNGSNGVVTVDWGDGTTVVTTPDAAGTLTHQYTGSGNFTVTVTDASQPEAVSTQQTTIPWA